MSTFWRRWLQAWCAVVGLFGLLLAGGAFPLTGAPAEALLRMFNTAVAPDFAAPLRFAVALMGCVTLGWSLTFLAAMQAAWRLGEGANSVWAMLTASLAVWFVMDSSLSIATGYGLNAVSNAVLFGLYLIPIWRSGVLGAPRVGLGSAAA
ncbi:hypothetical protein BH09PSE2_BH09PSE2_00250 [soil metagenome]